MGDVVRLSEFQPNKPKLHLVKIKTIEPRDIVDFVCRFEEMPTKRIFVPNSRAVDVTTVRSIIHYLCCRLTHYSVSDLGRFFGTDHSAIVHARKRIEVRRKDNPALDYKLAAYEEALSIMFED